VSAIMKRLFSLNTTSQPSRSKVLLILLKRCNSVVCTSYIWGWL